MVHEVQNIYTVIIKKKIKNKVTSEEDVYTQKKKREKIVDNINMKQKGLWRADSVYFDPQ